MGKQKKLKIAQQIREDCYWDSNITAQEIIKITEQNDFREKQKLFEKIIYNSTDRILALKLFNEKDIKNLFLDFKINSKYRENKTAERIKILKSIFLNQEVSIPGWEWIHRDL